jgi:hypothetical protein
VMELQTSSDSRREPTAMPLPCRNALMETITYGSQRTTVSSLKGAKRRAQLENVDWAEELELRRATNSRRRC